MVQTDLETRLAAVSAERKNYILRALPAQLADNGRLDALAKTLCHLGYIRAKCRAGLISELLGDFSRAIGVFDVQSLREDPELFPQIAFPAWIKECTSTVLKGTVGDFTDLGSGRLLSKLRAPIESDQIPKLLQPLVHHYESLPPGILHESNSAAVIIALRNRAAEAASARVQANGGPLERLRTFAAFVQQNANLIGRNPGDIPQAARNWAFTGVVGETAQMLVDAGETPWITRDPRPPKPSTESPCLRTLVSDFGAIKKLAISRDGAWAVTAARKLVAVWNLRDGVLHRKLYGHESRVCALALSDDASVCVSVDDSGMMLVWNPVKDAGGEVLTLSAASDRRVAISADGACLLSGGRDGAIRLWCVKSKRCVRTFEGHTARISDLAIVADGRLAISGSDDGYARVWDVAANRCLRTLFAGTQAKAVTAVAIARAGPFACTGHEDASLRMWELQTGRYLRRFKNVHEFKISAVAMSDDGSLIGSADASRRICIWDGLTGSLLHMFDHHGASVTGLALTQNERLAVSVGNDDTVKIWDLAFPGKEFRIWAHTDAVFCASRLTNRRPFDIPLALSGSSDKMVRLWDTRTGYCLRTLPGHRGPIYAVAFLPVRGQATSISSDGTIHVWNLKQGFAHRILPDSSRGLTHFAFDMKNGLAITVRADDIPTIWDLNRGCRIGTLTLSGSKLVGIAWLPNTTTVLTIDNSAVVRIHSVPAGETGYEWKVGCAGVVAWALSDDGEILALANDENALQVYDLHSRSCLSDLGNLCTRSRGLTFSKDRTALVSFDAERRVVVWHLTTDRGSDVFTLRNENKSISRVQVHPRAQYLACAQGASLVFVDLVRKEILSEYGCESEITSFSEVCPDGTTICGTRLGHLHFLKLRGWESPPVESHLI